jgi:hypothetical protein
MSSGPTSLARVKRGTAPLRLRPAAQLPGWLPLTLIAGSVVGLAVLFLWPSFSAFPMDDTYIHFVYARNLAERGLLFFNAPNEVGVGTTSILWVLLLAAGLKLGISSAVLAKLLGVASLVVVCMVLYVLLRGVWGPFPALLGAWLVGISGNMLWFALSGMETTFFLAVGLLALLAYRQERWISLGVALGMLGLIRPEGLALAVAVAAVDIVHRRKLNHHLIVSGLVCLMLFAPWALYLLWRTGSPISTSGAGKQLSAAVGLAYVVSQTGLPSFLANSPGLIYIGSWISYFLLFTLGGMSLPAPYMALGTLALNTYNISGWSLASWIVAGVLLYKAGARFLSPSRWRSWLQDDSRRILLVLVLWAVLHNACYMIFLPIPGTASRYGAINHVILWLALAAGLLAFMPRPRLLLAMSCALVAVAFANTLYWNRVYDANLDHMQNVRIQAAEFIAKSMPVEDRCAAFDVGALRYFSQRPILDLGGLIDPNAARVFEAGGADRYLLQRDVSCLILPGRTGRADEGWFDFARILGLSASTRIDLHLVRVFEIDRQRWLLGYLPTVNYQASVTVYRIQPASAAP